MYILTHIKFKWSFASRYSLPSGVMEDVSLATVTRGRSVYMASEKRLSKSSKRSKSSGESFSSSCEIRV